MNIRRCTHIVSVATLLATVLVPSAAQSANALLRDTNRQDVGTASQLQTPAGALVKLSLNGMPPGEHAFHIHAVVRAALVRFGGVALQSSQHAPRHHGGAWSCRRMPNLHIPSTGSLEVELVNTAITIDTAKPNSVVHPGGSAVVIHGGKDDYVTDPGGNAGNRIACGVISQGPMTVGRTPAQ